MFVRVFVCERERERDIQIMIYIERESACVCLFVFGGEREGNNQQHTEFNVEKKNV